MTSPRGQHDVGGDSLVARQRHLPVLYPDEHARVHVSVRKKKQKIKK